MTADIDDAKTLPGLFLTTAIAQILVEKKIITKEELLSKISGYSPANYHEGNKLLALEIDSLISHIKQW